MPRLSHLLLGGLVLGLACAGPAKNDDDDDDNDIFGDADTDADADVDADSDADADTDTDTDTRPDADGDGALNAAAGGDDCDDADASVYPGAYDRPNDGVDADCADGDRSFDGVVVDVDVVTNEVFGIDVGAPPVGLDIALLLDTTCSMTASLNGLTMSTIDAAVGASAGDVRYSFSTFDDYYYSGMGASGDLPFQLRAQVTTDIGEVQDAIDAASLHNGGDSPESGMEALYQALTGAGYDQDCDGTYDSTTDVKPFVSGGSDPFNGRTTGTYDASVSGTGALGGVGFREDGVPVIVLITDNYLRDPEASSSTYNRTPGGCPGDASASDVIASASALDAWIVGIDPAGAALPEAQFRALARGVDKLVDTTGDGSADDAPEYVVSANINSTVITALEDVIAVALGGSYGEVTVVVHQDVYGLVDDVVPDSFTDVAPGDAISFTVSLVGVETDEAFQTTLELYVYGDGELVETVLIEVEVAPG